MNARALAELAGKLGLTLLAEELLNFPPNHALRGAPNGPAPSPPPLPGAIGPTVQIIPHGAEPNLVAELLDSLAGRPVEQGLAAWDVLCTTFLNTRMTVALHDTLGSVRGILPPAGSQGLAFEALPVVIRDLAALESLSADELLTLAMASHHARLHTLASLYFLYLYGAHAEPSGLLGLCEVLLECGAPEQLPEALDHRLPAEMARYVSARTAALSGQARAWLAADQAAPGYVDFVKVRDSEVARTAPMLRMAEAQLGMAAGQLPFMYAVVDLIADAEPDWRFASRVRAAMYIWRLERESLRLVENHLARFGPDGPLWKPGHGRLAIGDPLWRELANIAMREAYTHPHDRDSWSGLIALTCLDWKLAEDQLASRLRAQCVVA
jgi:hypothetical protein